jgi:hypothetical protein
MPNLKKIDKVTVGAGGTSSITFSNIPQTYTDLKVLISARNTSTSGNESQIILTINGNGSAGSWNLIYGNSSAAISGAGSGYLQPAHAPSANTTANTFSNAEIYFPNYTSTSTYKSFSSDFVTENNLGTANSAILGIYANLWSNTNAITSLTLTSNVSNFVQYSSATLYGISSVTTGSKATGGIVYSDSTHYYHVFPYSGTFTPTQSLTADYLVVAGGGGGPAGGGGGGAGGLRAFASQSLTAQNYTVTVGAGGVGTTGNATSGSNTTFNSTSVSGGGYGGNYNQVGGNGGSGGGGGPMNASPVLVGGSGNSGSYSPVEGYAGGNGSLGVPTARAGGGGGGASAVGSAANAQYGGAGGAGANSYNSITFTSWLTATNAGVLGYLAGGGGGLTQTDATLGPAAGGIGGGGTGSLAVNQSNTISPTSGTVNTGSGGGGGTAWGSGSSGGSGIVIIRYAI